MSQDTFPFADGAEPYGDEPERNRKTILLAGGVAAALVVVGGYFLLGGSGSTPVDSSFVSRPPKASAAAPKVQTPPAKKLPAAYKAQLGRDPFKALYVVPAAAPAASAAPAAAPPAAPAFGGAQPAAAAPVAAAPTTGTPTTGTTRYSLKLVSISKPSPQVRFSTWAVAGTSKTVIPGQRFGKYGELVVLAFGQNAKGVVDRAIIQVGDDSPIDVMIGETVSVL